MTNIVYNNIPCPVLKDESYVFLVLFKDEQKWIFRCSLGYGEIIKDAIGKYYYFNKSLHRENGPAIDYYNGSKKWFQNGKLHRLDGPAIEHNDGYKEWHQNDKLHRLDGPAVEWGNKKAWFIEDLEYSEKGYNKKIKEMKRDGTYSL